MKEKDEKNKKRKIIFLLFRVAALVLAFGYLGYVYIYQPYELSQVKVNTVAEEPTTPETLASSDGEDRSKFEATSPTAEEVIEARKSIEGNYGLLALDGTDLNVPVWLGLSDYALWRGGSTWDTEMRFGVGHTVMFGHNVIGSYLFGYIPRAEIGREIYAYDGKTIYVYEVVSSRQGEANETAYVKDGSFGDGKPTVTLVTCVGYYPTFKRWFVRGVLKVVVNQDSNRYTEILNKNNWK